MPGSCAPAATDAASTVAPQDKACCGASTGGVCRGFGRVSIDKGGEGYFMLFFPVHPQTEKPQLRLITYWLM